MALGRLGASTTCPLDALVLLISNGLGEHENAGGTEG